MLKVDTIWTDVNGHLARREQPVMVVERPHANDEPKGWAGSSEKARVGEFYVPTSSVLEPASPSQVWVSTARFVLSSSSQQPLPSRLASRFTSSRVACDGGT